MHGHSLNLQAGIPLCVAVVAAMLLVFPAHFCLAQHSAQRQSIDNLIAALADPDARVRADAAAQLRGIGLAARPALIAASRSDDTAISSAASRVLLALPWYRLNDPPLVRQLLADYGAADQANRIVIVSRLAELGGSMGVPVLLRLVMEDPSEDVCWAIVTMFPDAHARPVGEASPLRDPRGPFAGPLIRQLDPPNTRPAAMVLVAHAWLGKDRNRAVGLLRRAIQAEAQRPTYDDGELDFAFDTLADIAVGQHRYEEAAQLRRMQARRIGLTRDAYPTPVFDLLVLHARFGPLPGFEQDIRSFSQYLGYPQAMYALSRIYARCGQMPESMMLEQTALNSSVTTGSRDRVFRFLVDAGWMDLARAEAYATLNSDGQGRAEIDRINARLRLAAIAGATGGSVNTQPDETINPTAELIAAQHLTAAQVLGEQVAGLEHIGRRGKSVAFDPRDLTARIALRKARAAHAQGDDKTASDQLNQLMSSAVSDEDVVLPAYPLLKSLGREDDAARLFSRAYAAVKQRFDESPNDPVNMNELAWLCARCDQELTEALDLSTRAVAAEPDDAAFLDTLAEVNFRLGRTDEAIKHETRALELEPEDTFMQSQLERFKRAGSTSRP